MRTFNYIFAVLAVALATCVSCKKNAGVDNGIATLPEGQPLKVKANLAPISRTGFDNDGLTLLWEEGDQIAVYSSYLGSEEGYSAESGIPVSDEYFPVFYWINAPVLHPDYFRKGVCTIEASSAGQSSAVFSSSTPAAGWFGKTDSAEDEYFWFTAFYPARETLYDMGSHQFTWEGGMTSLPYIKVEIPSVQDGHSWDKYQFVACCAFDLLNDFYGGKVTRQEVLSGAKTPTFEVFKPMTSLLSFNIKAGESMSKDSYTVSRIEISQEASWQGVRRNDLYALSGTVPYFPFCDDMDEDGDTPLWNRHVAPNDVGNNYQADPVNGESWSDLSGLNNFLTLDFSESPLTITKTASEETYYAVTIPTNAAPDRGYTTINPVLIFTAYDTDNNEIMKARLRTPTSKGLLYGRRYDFQLTLNDPSVYTIVDIGAGATSAGDYGINDWNN